MSVCYMMCWDVAVRGSRSALSQIPFVVDDVVGAYADYRKSLADLLGPYVDQTGWYELIAKRIKAAVAKTLVAEGDGPFVVRFSCDDDDTTHGVFEMLLQKIRDCIFDVDIAARGIYVDIEYHEGQWPHYFLSPAGSEEIGDMSLMAMSMPEKGNRMPAASWVPQDLRLRRRKR